MKSKTLYDAFGYIDDWYLDIVDAPPKETNEMKKENKHFSARRTFTLILAAALCISILTVTAAAAGWIPGIFSSLKDQYPKDQELFEAAAKANADAEPTVVQIPEMDASKLTLFEKYYDGQTILLGYDLEEIVPEAVAGYEPDAELLKEIKEMSKFEHTALPEQTDDSLEQLVELEFITSEEYKAILENRTEHAKQHDMRNYHNITMDHELKSILTTEQYEQFWNQMETKGYGCVVTQEVYIGDHKFVNGADMSEPQRITEYETDAGSCLRLEPLPTEGQNKETVTVDLKVKSSLIYWYMELDGYAYQLYKPNADQTVSFTLENVNN